MAEPADQSFLQYMKERDAARAETERCTKEMRSLQVKLYDLNVKYSELQIKVMEDKEKKTNMKNVPAKAPPAQPKQTKTRSEKASAKPKMGTPHPIIPNHEIAADDSKLFYQTIGRLCPEAKLSVVLQAEKLFLEADKNGDGIIDVDELDNLFTKHLALYTRGQVEQILSSIDADGSNSLDFIEILEVMDKVDHGEKHNLPKDMQKNSKGSFICSIQ